MTDAGGTCALSEQLERWTAAGLIDRDQAAQIEQAERARAEAVPGRPGAPRRRLPLVAEVLGYVGALLAATAIGVALHQVWTHVPPAAWLAFTAVLAVGLLTGGAMVPVSRRASVRAVAQCSLAAVHRQRGRLRGGAGR